MVRSFFYTFFTKKRKGDFMAIELTNPMAGDLFKAEVEKALDKTGDTITGQVLVDREPTNDKEIINKKYADSLVNFVPGDKVLCEKSLAALSWSEATVLGGVATSTSSAITATPQAGGKIRVMLPTEVTLWSGVNGNSKSSFCNKNQSSSVTLSIYCVIDGMTKQILYEKTYDVSCEYYYYSGDKKHTYTKAAIDKEFCDISVLKSKTINFYIKLTAKNFKCVDDESLSYEGNTVSVFSYYSNNIKLCMGNSTFEIE